MTRANDISQLVNEHALQEKEWRPGIDWVQYAGTFFGPEEYEAGIASILDGWFGLGKHAIKFEKEFPAHLGKGYGILTNSGSSANLLMLAALKSRHNFGKDTRVATAVAGFPTTINPILQLGMKPVFVDICPYTFNPDFDSLMNLIRTKSVEVVMFAHPLGNPCRIDDIAWACKENGIFLLEDTCDGLGSTYDGTPLGGFGEMASCSFYPAHHITMGEGGFVATDDPEMEKVLRSLRDWGRACYCVGKKANMSECGSCGQRFSKWLEGIDKPVDHKYVYSEIGYNLKPIEPQAAIINEQLKRLPEICRRRKENAAHLHDVFNPYKNWLRGPLAELESDVSWFAYSLTVTEIAPFTRDEICRFFESKKIQTRPYFAGNILLHPAYRELPEDPQDYPNANYITENTFFLGTSPIITKEQIEYIKEILNQFMEKYR